MGWESNSLIFGLVEPKLYFPSGLTTDADMHVDNGILSSELMQPQSASQLGPQGGPPRVWRNQKDKNTGAIPR